MSNKPTKIEMRMMMLGAALVGTSPEAARIVAEAMAEMERLRKAKPKRRKRK